MSGEAWKNWPVFERWALALTGATLLLMVGWFVFDSVRLSDTRRVEVERSDSLEAAASETEREETDGLLEGEVIDLNTADVSDLERLPGVGATRAQAIVEYRQEHGAFCSVDDLLRADGIGPAILEQVRPYVKAG